MELKEKGIWIDANGTIRRVYHRMNGTSYAGETHHGEMVLPEQDVTDLEDQELKEIALCPMIKAKRDIKKAAKVAAVEQLK